MTTALDTSVLLTVLGGEPSASAWMDVLIKARRLGRLVICGVIYAEVAPFFQQESDLHSVLRDLGISFDPISPEAAWEAGRIFGLYKRNGGPREHLIPDFLVAAHALVQTEQLATRDRGYFRSYFRELRLLQPSL